MLSSLEAVEPSMVLLEEARAQLKGPVWINADILPGPGGRATPLDSQAFLQAVTSRAEGDVLSLGWTTGWSPDADNPGKSYWTLYLLVFLLRFTDSHFCEWNHQMYQFYLLSKPTS